MSAKLIIVNPSERSWCKQRFVLSFGAYGTTHLMVWGNLESALETAAEWLAENAPGHFSEPDYADACSDLGVSEADFEAMQQDERDGLGTSDMLNKIRETAEADLTQTESGYIPSWEWTITLDEHATRADVKAFISELAKRHYDDCPVVDITRKRSGRPLQL